MAKTIWFDKGMVVDQELITPDDEGTHEYDSLYIGSSIDIKYMLRSGNVIGPVPVNKGWFEVNVRRVYATGTTPGAQIWGNTMGGAE